MAKNDNRSEIFDIRALFRNYVKHWWWFAISLGVCGILAVLYVKTHRPEYGVHANVLVTEDNTGSFTSMSGVGDLFGSSAYVEDEIFVIGSHSVLRDVVRQLGINKTHIVKTGILSRKLAYPDFPVDVHAAQSLLDTLSYSIVFKVNVDKEGKADITAKVLRKTIGELEDVKLPATLDTKWGKYTIVATPTYPKGESLKTTVTVTGYDAAAEDLGRDITTLKASRKSNIINLFIQTSNAKYGLDILNYMIEDYNDKAITYKNMQAQKTLEFLDGRLALITGDLKGAENDIQTYKEQHSIVDVGTEAGYNMGMRGAAETKLAELQAKSELIKMTRDFVREPANAFEVIPATGNMGAASAAIEKYNSQIMYRMTLADNAKGNNVALRNLDRNLEVMRNSINTSLDKAYEASLVEVREAMRQANKAVGKLSQVPGQERAFRSLERQQAVKQQLYLFLLQRREETAMLIANAIPKGRIIDEAYVQSEPLGTSKMLVLLIAVFMGLVIPPVLLYIKSLLRNKFDGVDDLRKLTRVPILGEICADKSGRKLVVEANSTSSSIELFAMARTALQFILTGTDDKIITITSTRSGEGKSFISTNLAASMALSGKRVVLVGMDIRNPQLGSYLELSSAKGVTNFLAEKDLTVGQVILKSPLKNSSLDVILSGPVPPNPGELLMDDRVEEFFSQLRQLYDYIVVDSAPVGMVSDTFNIMRITDATVYVCRANFTTTNDINFLNDLYNDKRLRKPALLVNGTMSSRGYGYGYSYGQKKK